MLAEFCYVCTFTLSKGVLLLALFAKIKPNAIQLCYRLNSIKKGIL